MVTHPGPTREHFVENFFPPVAVGRDDGARADRWARSIRMGQTVDVKIRMFAPFLAVLLLLVACSSSDDSAETRDPDRSEADGTDDSGEGAGSGGSDDADCDWSREAPSTDFIVDRCGRVVILRGVNVESSAKAAAQSDDHLPKSPLEKQSLLRENWGWNTVRFLVFWGAIEPEPGVYDEDYLDRVEEWIDWYGENDIHVVIDMHQDLYAWAVGGNGAPDWAVDTQGIEVGEAGGDGPWWLHGADPGVQAAYQSFWNPEDGDTRLQDHFLDSLTHVAERFADHPAVIGYDVMNEPSFANGDLNATLAIQPLAAAGEFENENLTDFMNRGIEAVRAASEDQYVFIEPTSLLNVFPYAGDLIAHDIVDLRDGEPRIVYAGHLYESSTHEGTGYATDSTYVQEWYDLRVSEAADMNAALWFGEWGGTPAQDRMSDYIEDVLTNADEAMIGWAWWSWDPGGWSPIDGDLEDMTDNGRDLQRVQPQAIAGTPKEFGFDRESSVFTLTWTGRAEVGAPNLIAVPAGLYDDGIEVFVDGEELEDPDWDRSISTLRFDATADDADHELCIAPAGSGACA